MLSFSFESWFVYQSTIHLQYDRLIFCCFMDFTGHFVESNVFTELINQDVAFASECQQKCGVMHIRKQITV